MSEAAVALTERIDWEKVDGLVPAIIQDFQSSQVLMMGYMNPEALEKTLETEQVTFFLARNPDCGRKEKRQATYSNFVISL